MARVRIHVLCGQPADQCGCPPDDPDDLEPAGDRDGGDEGDQA
jgi:hypothetical protein